MRSAAGGGGCRWRGGLFLVVVLVVEVETDGGVGGGAADFDRDKSACAILRKEGIDGFEEPGFPAGDHLGYVGVEAGGAGEVEGLAFDVVDALHGDVGAGDAVVDGGQSELARSEGEVAAHLCGDVGGGGRGQILGWRRVLRSVPAGRGVLLCILHGRTFLVGLLGFALAAETEFVDLALNLVAGEVGIGQIEAALETDLVGHGSRTRGQIEFGVDLDLAGHEGLVGFDGETEHVLDVAGIDGELEADVATLDAGDVDDLALGDDVGVQEPCIDGLEVGIAVGAVDDGVEFGVERQGVVGDVEAEVGGGGGAVHNDVVELALVAAVR